VNVQIHQHAKTPAARHLISIKPEVKKLPVASAQIFHQMAAKLLYLSSFTRQEIQSRLEFLCTRVKTPDKDTYKNFTRVMLYERDHINNQWWLDSSYSIHPDMRSYSSIVIMLGKGVMYSISCKQKISMQSSTEAD